VATRLLELLKASARLGNSPTGKERSGHDLYGLEVSTAETAAAVFTDTVRRYESGRRGETALR
jgi:hypothetical protein